jgi:hypothetical protein
MPFQTFTNNEEEKTMKRLVFFVLIALVYVAPLAYAQQSAPLSSNLELKVDWIYFTDDAFGDVDLEDGIYVGVAGWVPVIIPNFFVGAEAGWAGASSDGEIDTSLGRLDTDLDVTYVPVELNAKYVIPVHPCWMISLGGGISFNYFSLDVDIEDFSRDEDDWVFGGQFFADVTYTFPNSPWFVGIGTKYQITEDMSFGDDDLDIDTNVSASNFRTGVRVGMAF